MKCFKKIKSTANLKKIIYYIIKKIFKFVYYSIGTATLKHICYWKISLTIFSTVLMTFRWTGKLQDAVWSFVPPSRLHLYFENPIFWTIQSVCTYGVLTSLWDLFESMYCDPWPWAASSFNDDYSSNPHTTLKVADSHLLRWTVQSVSDFPSYF